jgi:hypothetical protein
MKNTASPRRAIGEKLSVYDRGETSDFSHASWLWIDGGKKMTLNLPITRRTAALAFVATVFLPRNTRAAWPLVTVPKYQTCGCCGGWIAHLELNGFPTKTIETNTINRVRARLGIPFDLAACHTAEVNGYLIEGHVPASAIQKLLTERPKATGLAVPGMPSGSPGMTGEFEEYDVILFGPAERRVFARFKGETQI